jgi:hypothetical protein
MRSPGVAPLRAAALALACAPWLVTCGGEQPGAAAQGTPAGPSLDASTHDSSSTGADGDAAGSADSSTDAPALSPFEGVWAVTGQPIVDTCAKGDPGALVTFRLFANEGKLRAQVPTGDGASVPIDEMARSGDTLWLSGNRSSSPSAGCDLDTFVEARVRVASDGRTCDGELAATAKPGPGCSVLSACVVRSSFTGRRLARDALAANLTWSALPLEPALVASEVALMGGLWFGGALYLGTWNPTAAARLLRTKDLSAFESPWPGLLADPQNFLVAPLFLDGEYLYAGSWEMNIAKVATDPFAEVDGFDLVRTRDGETWQSVTTAGMAEYGASAPAHNSFPTSAQRVGPWLYLGVFNPVDGPQVWRSADGAAFELVIPKPGATPAGWSGCNTDITTMVEYAGTLCFSTEADKKSAPKTGCTEADAGAQVWCLQGGSPPGWRRIGTGGFGRPINHNAHLTVCRDRLYATTWNRTLGFELLRYGGEGVWIPIASNGFGQPANTSAGIACLPLAGQQALAMTTGGPSGTELWATALGDGSDGPGGWRLLHRAGFDEGHSMTTAYFVLGGRLHLGTLGPGAGILDVTNVSRGGLFRLECPVDQSAQGCLPSALGLSPD